MAINVQHRVHCLGVIRLNDMPLGGLLSAKFVLAQVDRDAPEIASESSIGAELISLEEKASEGFLNQILTSMPIVQDSKRRLFKPPLTTPNQLSKGPFIASRLDAGHELFIACYPKYHRFS
jgi:hypothetical protein